MTRGSGQSNVYHSFNTGIPRSTCCDYLVNRNKTLILTSKLRCYSWGGLDLWMLGNSIVFTLASTEVYPYIPLVSAWLTAA